MSVNKQTNLWLVDHGQEPAGDVVETGAELGVENHLIRHHQIGHAADVGQRNAFADQKGPQLEMLVESGEGGFQVGLGSLAGLLVEGHDTHARENPRTSGRQDFVVGEGDPLLDESLVFCDCYKQELAILKVIYCPPD